MLKITSNALSRHHIYRDGNLARSTKLPYARPANNSNYTTVDGLLSANKQTISVCNNSLMSTQPYALRETSIQVTH